ncbi:MAG: sugar phosphate nucleotidyltransferase [Bacteroidales bacterium]
MKVIIPMAGKGKRMRPHTLTTPKPLIKLAGKTIVSHLLNEINSVLDEPIEEINFVIGDFGEQVENELKDLARSLNAKPKISYQEQALGTAHAVYCAKKSLKGKVIIAFSDTLFKASFKLNTEDDGIIWTKRVDNPSSFGVVKKNENNLVSGFYEKPSTFVSDEAIIGVYYFKKGEDLAGEIKYLLDNQIMGNSEYQLTDALENLRRKENRISTSIVNKWFDCGNKKATVDTNQQILKYLKDSDLISPNSKNDNSIIINPCYIGENVHIKNSVIGPYVSVESNTIIENALINNSIIQSNTIIKNLNISGSMIGNHAEIIGNPMDLSAGDYTNLKY